MSAYDNLDRRVLAVLRKGSREKLPTYTLQTRIPKSTVHDRINRLVKSGMRCTSLLDWDALGCPFVVFALAPFDPNLVSHPAVNSCSHLAHDMVFAECLFSTALELELFRKGFPSAKLYPLVSTIKREGFIPSYSVPDDSA